MNKVSASTKVILPYIRYFYKAIVRAIENDLNKRFRLRVLL